jgi:drug/metabolite transporter (DMT)-like permease
MVATAPASARLVPTAPTTAAATSAALYYIIVSCVLTTNIKVLFNKYPAVHPPLLLLAQALVTLAIFVPLVSCGVTSVPSLPPRNKRISALVLYIPLLLAYALNLTTSVIALHHTSLLMYNTLRRTSILFVVGLHAIASREYPSTYTVVSTALTLAGALYASMNDLTYDPIGYALAITANVMTAVYLVRLRPVRDGLFCTNLQLQLVNTAATVPLLCALLAFTPPPEPILPLLVGPDHVFQVLYMSSCALAMVLTHSTYVNTIVNDAVAQMVSAQVKDFVLLAVSYILVDDPAGRYVSRSFLCIPSVISPCRRCVAAYS